MSPRVFALAVLALIFLQSTAFGELVRWEITKREPYANGKPRGAAGPYEQWTGTVHFSLDPAHPANGQIVDLKLAPRNASGQGRVLGRLPHARACRSE